MTTNAPPASPRPILVVGSSGKTGRRVADRLEAIVADLDTPAIANDVKVAGDTAYIADGSSGLRIVDVSDPLAPQALGFVEIREIAREVGGRTKIAVYSRDDSIDPVGACVGLKGSRVQAVVSELGGERIDIVPWHPDTEVFARRALAPARVAKVLSKSKFDRRCAERLRAY